MLYCSCLWTQFLWYITLFQDIYCRLTKNQHVHCSSLDDWDWLPPRQFNAITRRELTLLSSAVYIRWEDGRMLADVNTWHPSFSLHWLPVKQRILYKIGILSFHRVRGDGPGLPQRVFSRVLTRLAVRTLDPLLVVTLSYPEQIQWLSVRAVSVSLIRLLGTCYLSIWGIWTFPLLCLKVNWKHFYSCEPSRALLRHS